jgi:hypothetical protein
METLRHVHGDMDMETWRHGDMETWRHGDMKTWTWRHGHGDMDMETWTWRHGYMETWTWRHGDLETRRHGHGDMETSNAKQKTEAQVIFLHPLTICSPCKRKLVVCPFVDKETNGSYPFVNGLNELNGLAHL